MALSFSSGPPYLLSAELVYTGGEFRRDFGIDISPSGDIIRVAPLSTFGRRPNLILERSAVIPGLVNGHSHAFQRLLRGRTQTPSPGEDDFWTWRQQMYQVAGALTPEDMFVVARQAFLEMALAGTTTVGEFHYLHHRPDGSMYDDENAMAGAIIEAAAAVGMRLCLLRGVYLHADVYGSALGPRQCRFGDSSLAASCQAITNLGRFVAGRGDSRLSVGIAAHSVRALTPDELCALKTTFAHLPFHIHASEQRREVEQCLQRFGTSPVGLVSRIGALDGLTTVVHATHLVDGDGDTPDFELLQQSGTTVCVCPTTEADLGDGLIHLSKLSAKGIELAVGTDGQTRCSIVEEASRLEMHERLRLERRNALRRPRTPVQATLRAATLGGARSLGLPCGEIKSGNRADLVAFDLDDPALAGCECAASTDEVLASIFWSADTRAVTDVMVGGRWIVRERQHRLLGRSQSDFAKTLRAIVGC